MCPGTWAGSIILPKTPASYIYPNCRQLALCPSHRCILLRLFTIISPLRECSDSATHRYEHFSPFHEGVRLPLGYLILPLPVGPMSVHDLMRYVAVHLSKLQQILMTSNSIVIDLVEETISSLGDALSTRIQSVQRMFCESTSTHREHSLTREEVPTPV